VLSLILVALMQPQAESMATYLKTLMCSLSSTSSKHTCRDVGRSSGLTCTIHQSMCMGAWVIKNVRLGVISHDKP
jgi:hypothetical protein